MKPPLGKHQFYSLFLFLLSSRCWWEQAYFFSSCPMRMLIWLISRSMLLGIRRVSMRSWQIWLALPTSVCHKTDTASCYVCLTTSVCHKSDKLHIISVCLSAWPCQSATSQLSFILHLSVWPCQSATRAGYSFILHLSVWPCQSATLAGCSFILHLSVWPCQSATLAGYSFILHLSDHVSLPH